MKFSCYIIDELVKSNIISDSSCVQMVSYDLPAQYSQYDVSIRVNDIKNINVENLNKKLEIISDGIIAGNYINFQIEWGTFIELLFQHISDNDNFCDFANSEYKDKKIAIEHTSITPVYPINLATFRSSVIGEAIKNLLEHYGAKVKTHFFVEDLARQIELLYKGIDSIEQDFEEIETKGKIDHIFGKIFTATYGKLKNNNVVLNRLEDMFPYGGNISFKEEISQKPLTIQKRKEISEKCLKGYNQTLEIAKISINHYDFESQFTYDFEEEAFKEPSIFKMLIETEQKIPYYLRNCAYFSGIKKSCDEFYTVISARQRESVNETLDALASTKGINAIYFGDVLISDDDEKNALDSIKEGIFHSVDQYVDVMSKLYQCSCDMIINSLKFKMLSTSPNKCCCLDDTACNQHDNFFAIYNFIKALNQYRESKKFVYDDSIKPLCKKIVKFEEVIKKILVDKNFSHLTSYLDSLYKEACSINDANNNCVFEDARLRESICKIFQISFEILDID